MDRESLEESDFDQSSLWKTFLKPWSSGILPQPEELSKARSALQRTLPDDGLGFHETKRHLFEEIIPALNGSSISPNYYGFVTGGVTPAALLADNIVSSYDQNVQVHLPDHSIVTDIESLSLCLLLELFDLKPEKWLHRTMTTGATASNILGLACGREYVLRAAAEKKGLQFTSVGEHGITEVITASGLRGLQVLSTLPHSSLGKAASILGIGRMNVKNICLPTRPLKFDMERLESELSRSDMASVVAISCCEVNTGHFATYGLDEFKEIRRLCDKYGAWLHVDGAMGIFARIFDEGSEFDSIKRGSEGLELADSITGDGHKLLNVPYDCAFFFSHHLAIAHDVFQNPNAAYLGGSLSIDAVPSPNNIGIENSRRFRALPVYASVLAYGRRGYKDMLEKQVTLARRITGWLFEHPAYSILPHFETKEELLNNTFMIVLFKAKDKVLNHQLPRRINAHSRIFVSGTRWEGQPACRIAISNWRVNIQRDFQTVTEVLGGVSHNV